jgi:ABC-type antimicrobial peptide transport system permease subunit
LIDGAIVSTTQGTEPCAPVPYYYLPYWRETTGEGTLLIRTVDDAGSPGALVRDTLRQIDSRLEPRLMITMAQYIDFSSGSYRTTAALAMTLGGIGLLLMTLGVYGVITHQTSGRTREIGIRVAVGAARGEVLRLVLGGGWRLLALGVALGVPLALLAGHALTSLLFGVGPWSIVALAIAATVLLVTVTLATLIPAWRATRLSAVTALREG